MKKQIVSFVLILVVLAMLSLLLLLTTPIGFRISLGFLQIIIPGKLVLKDVQGTMGGPIYIKDLSYQNSVVSVDIHKMKLDWHLFPFLLGRAYINRLEAHSLAITISPDEKFALPPDFILPLQFTVNSSQIKQFTLAVGKNQLLNINDLRFTGVTRKQNFRQYWHLSAVWYELEAPIYPFIGLTNRFGSLNLQGYLSDYQFKLDTLPLQNAPPFNSWHVAGNGSLRRVNLNDIRVMTLDGTILGSGTIELEPIFAWNLALQAKHLNPKIYWPYASGQLNFDFLFQGTLLKEKINATINLENLRGTIENYPVQGQLQVKVIDNNLVIENAEIQLDQANLRLAGNISDSWNLNWDVRVPQSVHFPNISGNLISQGLITGPRSMPIIKGNVQINDLSYKQNQIKNLTAIIDTELKPQGAILLKLDATEIALGKQMLTKTHIELQGHTDFHRLTAMVQQNARVLRLTLDGHFKENNWQGTLKEFYFTSPDLNNWKLVNPVNISLSPAQLQMDNLCLQATLQQACFQLNWLQPSVNWLKSGTLSAKVSAKEINLSPWILLWNESLNLNSKLSMEATFRKTNAGLIEGAADVKLSPALLTYKTLRGSQTFNFTGGEIQIRLDKKAKIASVGQFKFASLPIPQLGITISGISFTAQSNQQGNLLITGTAQSGKGKLMVDGEANLAQRKATLTLKGDNLLIANTSEYTVLASPNLKLVLQDSALALEGEVFIPSGTIQRKDLDSSNGKISEDIIFIHNKRVVEKPIFTITTKIHITLGNDVKVKFESIQGNLAGSLWLYYASPGQTTAQGELHIENGQYITSGQVLTIREGRLLYTGGPITNPIISLIAVRTISSAQITPSLPGMGLPFPGTLSRNLSLATPNQVIVGINAQGTAKHYTVKLFSEPPIYSQSDILSMMLLGRPSSDISKVGAQTVLKAASSLNLEENSLGNITQQIQQTFGLDVLGVQSQTIPGAQFQESQTTSLVVGKQLTQRLFISYSMGILQPINVLRIRYLLNKNWSIQSESSSLGSGVDLFYSIETDSCMGRGK